MRKWGLIEPLGLILALLAFGCTSRLPLPENDSGTAVGTRDAPFVCVPEEAAVGDDFLNCGFCGNICNERITDRCEVGTCLCGNDLACDETTQECRFGACHDVNLAGEVCEFDEECPAGYGCIRAHCSFITCVPEVCDNVDNDCDGVVDGMASGPLSRWCYDRDVPVTRTLNPPCEQGVQACNAGTWTECRGAISPIAEIGILACDGEDNDCDGCPDGLWTTEEVCSPLIVAGFDVVYAVDVSGSMSSTINAVRTATATFSAMYRSNPEFRFGLVTFPSYTRDGASDILLRLSDFATFEAALMTVTTNGGADEPNVDVIAQLGSGELDVGWRRGTIRIIILFSDERAQSYTTPRNNEMTMCATLTHGEVLAVVENPSYFSSFDDCGLTFELTSDPTEMVTNLSTIIADPCAP